MAQANEQQHQPTSACPCTHAHAQVLPRRSIGYDEQFSSQCIVRTRATRSSTKFAHAAWPSPSSGHHAETRHPGTADAAQRQARVGLRERKRARTHSRSTRTRPATSQHRVGKGAGEAAAHLACESVLEGFRQRKLRCRYFATRGGPAARSLRWPRKLRAETPLKLRPKFCVKVGEIDGQLNASSQIVQPTISEKVMVY